MSDDKLIKIILILVLMALMAIGYSLFAKNAPERQIERENHTFLWVQGSAIKASVVPAWFKPQIYGTLIDCLSLYESSHNPEAIGKSGEKGILQFMPSTFQQYCVGKYKLPNDIFDPELQQICADYMLQDNFNNLRHWTTANRCWREF